MGSDGSRGPRPFKQHRASTTFIRVHPTDWPKVSRGYKTEFRGAIGASSRTFNVDPPTPVLIYSRLGPDRYESKLMVLTETWQEPLGAISDESLRLEGFETLAQFRRHWMLRERKRFRPTRRVFVYRVRPWEPGDAEELGVKIVERLYGEFGEPVHGG